MKEKRTRIRRKNMGYRRLLLLIVIIFILIFLFVKVIFPATVSLSRYVYSVVKSFYLNSKEFYFTSDRLAKDIDDAHFEADNWSGASNYEVEVNLYSKKNALKVSSLDINYELSYEVEVYIYDSATYTKAEEPSKYIDFSITGETGEAGEARTIYATNNNTDSFTFTISPKTEVNLSDNDYVYVKITADATSPYTDTLYGEFYIYVGKSGLSYQIDDSVNSPYLNVVLTNASEEYVVDTAFGSYAEGTVISAETYLELLEDDSSIADYCHSMYVTLTFDPTVIVLDTTSTAYLVAKSVSNWTGTTNVTKNETINSVTTEKNYTYYETIQVEVEALESQVVKFYKLDVSNDYTYPNSDNSSIVAVSVVE